MPPTVAAAIAADVMTRAQLSSGFGRTQCRWFPPPELRSSKRNLALYECVPPRTDSFAFLCPREVANRRWERTEDVLFPFVLMRSEFAARLQNALLAAGIYWLKTGTARPKAISAGLHKNNPRYSQVPFKVFGACKIGAAREI